MKVLAELLVAAAILTGVPAQAAAPAEQVAQAAGETVATTNGTVNAVDPATGVVNMTHNPIPALGWPAMTMDFGVAKGVDLSKIKKGDAVTFTVAKGADGAFRVGSIKKR